MAVDERLRTLLGELSDARRQLREGGVGLREGGGRGTSGGVTDDWKASVDRQLEQLHGDIRHLLYALIAGFLLLAGGGWVLYDRQATRIEGVEAHISRIEVRQAEMDGKLDLLLDRKAAAKAP